MTDLWFDDVFYRCKHEDMQKKVEQFRHSFKMLVRCIRSIYEEQEEGVWEVKGLLEQFLNVDTIGYADVDNLMVVFQRMQKMLMGAGHTYSKAQWDLFPMIYQRIIRVMDQRIWEMRERSMRDSFDMKLFVQKTLQFEKGTDQSYGVLLENLNWLFESGEFLVNHLSSATKMIQLLLSNQNIQQKLEDSLVVLRENNIVLDNLSKSDSLTGIWNRRGLYEQGRHVVRRCHEQGRHALVIYADMNNLKIINDRYGHEEGDFSLKAIADRLAETAGSEGVAGRIGGDEVAGICPYDAAHEGEDALTALYATFDRFNEESDRKYNVTVSAGACVLEPGSAMSLEEALSVADERLYEVKKQRSKEVAKSL